ncbi:hypothetical protein CN177_32770 [Sinorhizobium meliloti]|nr:hypothetical protein CN177_32770 [Sinorhizobium meliloti]
MYSGDEAYDAALHYFEVISLNRPDIQGGPKRYFRHLQAALIYAASLRVGLEKVSTISISCKASGEHADVCDGDPRFC